MFTAQNVRDNKTPFDYEGKTKEFTEDIVNTIMERSLGDNQFIHYRPPSNKQEDFWKCSPMIKSKLRVSGFKVNTMHWEDFSELEVNWGNSWTSWWGDIKDRWNYHKYYMYY